MNWRMDENFSDLLENFSFCDDVFLKYKAIFKVFVENFVQSSFSYILMTDENFSDLLENFSFCDDVF